MILMKSTSALVDELYPKIQNSLNKNLNKYKAMIARFIDKRNEELYDTCPASRIYFGIDDTEDFFKSIDISVKDVTDILSKTYYYKIAAFNPQAAKDELTVCMMMIIRYFHKKKMQKELEISVLYLAFSGKFYPSVHYGSFPKVQPSEHRHVIEYVVNNMLTNKFDLKTQGSVFGAVKSICLTWLDTYEDKIENSDDEDIVYLIQQLHDRIKSFMINIATLYYEAYNSKDSYMTYDSDSLDEDSYRLADNDSLKAERIIEKAIQYINTNGVDYKICKMASDSNVKTDEVKSIIETILNTQDTIDEVRELIKLLVVVYFEQSKNKDVTDISFITFCISPKPNTKDKNILRQKEIVEGWLNEKSDSYRKRRSRLATKNSYHKSIYTYFTLIIHYANK
jgi:hypothetical protein